MKAKRDEKKGAQLAERRAADEERLAERKRKDADTMDMCVVKALYLYFWILRR